MGRKLMKKMVLRLSALVLSLGIEGGAQAFMRMA